MQKRFKFVTLIYLLAALLGLFGVTGCGSNKLSPDFSKDEVQAAAETVINKLNAKDAAGIRNLCNSEMKAALTDETMTKVFDAVAEGGAFVSFTDYAFSGAKNKNNDEEYAVVVVKAKYELKSFVFTISFTKQMKLAGLYYK